MSTAPLSLRRWLGTARSRVGQKLSDLTSQRVVVGILTMLFFIPGFASNYMLWGTYTSLAGGGLQMLHDLFIAQGNSSSFVTVRHVAILPSHTLEYDFHRGGSGRCRGAV